MHGTKQNEQNTSIISLDISGQTTGKLEAGFTFHHDNSAMCQFSLFYAENCV